MTLSTNVHHTQECAHKYLLKAVRSKNALLHCMLHHVTYLELVCIVAHKKFVLERIIDVPQALHGRLEFHAHIWATRCHSQQRQIQESCRTQGHKDRRRLLNEPTFPLRDEWSLKRKPQSKAHLPTNLRIINKSSDATHPGSTSVSRR